MFNDFLNGLPLAAMLIVMIVGLVGLVIPIFPGGIIIWLVNLAYGLIYGFDNLGIFLFVIITIFMIISTVGDNILMGKAAHDKGASWLAIILGLGAGIVGTLVFPPFGGIIGAPLVLFVVEYARLSDAKLAGRITRGLIIGWGWSFVLRFGFGVGMIVLWGIWVWSSV
ncbi:MAG: DUF456 domain-containing protein [Chloroflexota bacterium]